MKEIMSFSKTPNELLAEISETLHRYSVALIKVPTDGNGMDGAFHIGSGTLVSIDKTYGILTAQHVSRSLDNHCSLGLTIGIEAQEVAFRINKDYLHIIDVATPKTEEYGPDLSFIVIPTLHVGTIKALRSFYPLLFDKEFILQNDKTDTDIWCLCGAPEIETKEESSERFGKVLSFYDYCGFGGLPYHYDKDGYDYTEMKIDNKQEGNIPLRFNGMSGGGLWQVLITSSTNGDVKVNNYLLSGVMFFQLPREGDNRIIRCHGRRSIYEYLINAVQAIHQQ